MREWELSECPHGRIFLAPQVREQVAVSRGEDIVSLRLQLVKAAPPGTIDARFQQILTQSSDADDMIIAEDILYLPACLKGRR